MDCLRQPSSPQPSWSGGGGLQAREMEPGWKRGRGEHHSQVRGLQRGRGRGVPPLLATPAPWGPTITTATTSQSWQEATGCDLHSQSDKEMSRLGSRTEHPLRGAGGWPPAVSLLLSNEQGIPSLGLISSPITNLLYSKHEVHGPIFLFLNGSPLAKTDLDVNFILVGGE